MGSIAPDQYKEVQQIDVDSDPGWQVFQHKLGVQPDAIHVRQYTGTVQVIVGDGFGGTPEPDENVYYVRYTGAGTATVALLLEVYHSVTSFRRVLTRS